MTPFAIDAHQLMQMAPLGGQLGHPRLQMPGGPPGTVGGMSDLQNLVNRVQSQQLQRCPAPDLGTHDQTHLAGAGTMPHAAVAYGGQALLPYGTTAGVINQAKTSTAQPTTGSADSSNTAAAAAVSHQQQQQQQMTCHVFSGTNDFNSASADHGVIFLAKPLVVIVSPNPLNPGSR